MIPPITPLPSPALPASRPALASPPAGASANVASDIASLAEAVPGAHAAGSMQRLPAVPLVDVHSFHDEATDREGIRVVDQDTGQLLLQLPSDHLLRFYASTYEADKASHVAAVDA